MISWKIEVGERPRRFAVMLSNASTCSRQILSFLLAVFSCLLVSSHAFGFSCSVSTAPNVAFGSIDVTPGTSIPNNATLGITCTGSPSGQTMTMCVSFDGGSASNSSNRFMVGPGGAQLGFQLYSNSGYSTPWGSWPANLYGGGYNFQFPGTTSTSSGSTTVYGLVLSGQAGATAGSYSSTINLFFQFDNRVASCPDASPQGTASSTFTVTATVIPVCSINAATLNFGTWSGAAVQVGATENTTTVTVQCSSGVPYAVGMGGGLNASGSQNRMASGGHYINYGLYLDSGYSVPWTTASNSTTCTNSGNCYLGTGTGSAQSLTVYGKVPAVGIQPAPGTYNDTVVMTVMY